MADEAVQVAPARAAFPVSSRRDQQPLPPPPSPSARRPVSSCQDRSLFCVDGDHRRRRGIIAVSASNTFVGLVAITTNKSTMPDRVNEFPCHGWPIFRMPPDSVFPAPARMNRRGSHFLDRIGGVPRARGNGIVLVPGPGPAEVVEVSPAPVGMNRGTSLVRCPHACVPHVCGDDPDRKAPEDRLARHSPRLRR